jgi:hypothetical protein
MRAGYESKLKGGLQQPTTRGKWGVKVGSESRYESKLKGGLQQPTTRGKWGVKVGRESRV